MKRVFGLLGFSLIALSLSLAQRVTPSGQFVLNLDYAKFRLNDSSGYLEIYYGYYPRLISYDRRGERFEGALVTHTRLRDLRTNAYVFNRYSTIPVHLADTSEASSRSTLVSQTGHALAMGDYVLEVVVIDSLAPSRKDSLALPISVKAFAGSTICSDLELCSLIKASDQTNDPFYKNSLEVVPNPTLVFGVASHPVMFSYAELYNVAPQQTYTVKTQVVGQDGKVVKETTKPRKFGVRNAVEVGTMNVSSIESGKYRFRLIIADEAGSSLAQAEKTFYIYNPHIQKSQASSYSAKASELAGLSGEELATEFRQAQYAATDQEIKTFSQITSAEGRREFLAKFWTEVEAGRLGQTGIPRVVYLQRVLTATQRFRAMGHEGWQTDRGRVYILYSEPDEIERFPSSYDSKPYEIWHYYGIENGIEFDFIDRSGFGDYVLVNSTRRGEIRDDDWKRFLQ
jgi:GWxTD domain-containing protein